MVLSGWLFVLACSFGSCYLCACFHAVSHCNMCTSPGCKLLNGSTAILWQCCCRMLRHLLLHSPLHSGCTGIFSQLIVTVQSRLCDTRYGLAISHPSSPLHHSSPRRATTPLIAVRIRCHYHTQESQPANNTSAPTKQWFIDFQRQAIFFGVFILQELSTR
jgi:hypothetical protein